MTFFARIPEPELMDLPAEARAYAAADFSAVNKAFVDRLFEVVGSTDAQVKIVDLGCGPADIPIRIVRARPSWLVVAVDAAEAMLDLARAAVESADLFESIPLIHASAIKTGLPTGAFDVVCSNSILHHVADPAPFWREVRRLAKPGGSLFLRDLMRPIDRRDVDRLVKLHAGGESALLQEEFHRSLLAAYTVAEVKSQLLDAGLEGLTVEVVSDRHLDVFGELG